eukprot:TRINITY_DN8603_c0_g1_i1.p1 TRINITY_DN8603_c0_g1~~TRINITY_DN8603_c0_g1_i1.p1  ORF type:complete len:330 (-),score=114.31 TRINITY_DN8603_c0_g1_i1:10-999(-)
MSAGTAEIQRDILLGFHQSLLNSWMLVDFVNVVLRNTNAFAMNDVIDSLDCLSTWFQLVNQRCGLPFEQQGSDYWQLLMAIDMLLDTEHYAILMRTLKFVYDIVHMVSGSNRLALVDLLMGNQRFYALFLHWFPEVRRFYQLLVIYRLSSDEATLTWVSKLLGVETIKQGGEFSPDLSNSNGNNRKKFTRSNAKRISESQGGSGGKLVGQFKRSLSNLFKKPGWRDDSDVMDIQSGRGKEKKTLRKRSQSLEFSNKVSRRDVFRLDGGGWDDDEEEGEEEEEEEGVGWDGWKVAKKEEERKIDFDVQRAIDLNKYLCKPNCCNMPTRPL